MRTIATLALVALLTACGGTATDGAAPEPTSQAQPSPQTGPSPHTQSSPGTQASTVTGTLGGDAELEGGCVWLDTDSGRIEVIWPDGWTASADPVELRDPAGEAVAVAGDEVRLEGSPAPDMVSTCQVGEIWTATAVTAPSTSP